MSQRPPATYWIHVTGTGDAGSSDPSQFSLAASGPTKVPIAIGQNLRLQGIAFGADADGASLVASPSELPAGQSQPRNVTLPISGPSWVGLIPATIDGSTTAFPFTLCFGALGLGAR